MTADPIYEPEPEQLIELDTRDRASLRALNPTSSRYLAHKEPNGVIVFRPAVVVTELEAKLQARPDLLARFEANRNAGFPGRRGRPERTNTSDQAGEHTDEAAR